MSVREREKIKKLYEFLSTSLKKVTYLHCFYLSILCVCVFFFNQVTEQVQGVSADPEARATHVTVSWNGFLVPNTNVKQHEITSEFLQPYSNGVCAHHYNCLSCLTDTLCSWCQVSCVYQ